MVNKEDKIMKPKIELINFLNKINLGDEIDTTVAGYDVAVWTSEVSWNSHWRSLAMFIQIDNNTTGEHYYRGDIESNEELKLKLSSLQEKILGGGI